MHILFLSDNFPPEGNAPATRTYEHAREWIKRGHKVTVITCAPNFPEGKVFVGYRNHWLKKELIDGIEVWRVKTFISANQGFLSRTIDYVSFMLSSLLFGVFCKNLDVVLGTSPQFFTVISAWALSKLKRVPFIFELRDLWPASITAVDAMKKGKIIYFLEKVEMFLYHQATAIITVTNSFKKELKKRGIPGDKIYVVVNGVDLSMYDGSQKKEVALVERYELHDKFVAGYIGTHGLAHALDKVVEAACLLEKYDDIRIVFVGGGADRKRIESLVKAKDLRNVVMIPRQPKEMMPAMLGLCDVSLVHLRNTPLFKKVIPSKIFESMGMGIPIIISAPSGEATDIIKDGGLGLVVAPENPIELAAAIKSMHLEKNIIKFQKNSLSACQKYNRLVLANKMLNIVEQIIENKEAVSFEA